MEDRKKSAGHISQKEVQKKIRGILMQAIGLMGIKVPSKKLKKEVKQASRTVGERLLLDLAKASKAKQSNPVSDKKNDKPKQK